MFVVMCLHMQVRTIINSIGKYMKNSCQFGNNFFSYIKNNSKKDPFELMLSDKGKDPGFPLDQAVTQIECRQKCARKLSRFLECEEFIFPSVLSAEQSTHQCVAAYHAGIAGSHKNILDMTAGLGIDSFAFSKAGNYVTSIELDSDRAAALAHNKEMLGLRELEVLNQDSIKFLENNGHKIQYDVIFIDPARRGDSNRRLYNLSDCVPDVTSNWKLLSESADMVMVKASPMLDITQTLRDFPTLTSIHIVCVKGECKEVLLISENRLANQHDVHITAVDLDENASAMVKVNSIWRCLYSETGGMPPIANEDNLMRGYIYDPNAAIHKMNCGMALCNHFKGLNRISSATDLYWSEELHRDFPGRIFRIIKRLDNREMKTLRGSRANIATRNYPLSPQEIGNRYKIQNGGDRMIFAFRAGQREKTMMILSEMQKF